MKLSRSLVLLSLFASCGSIDPAPPTDADGNEIIVPGAFDTYLRARALYPATVGVQPIIELEFDGFIDPRYLLDFSVVTLASGGITQSGRVRWRVSDRTLEFRPFSPLIAGLRYRPRLDANRLRSVTGAPFATADLPTFLVDDTLEPSDPAPPEVTWAEVDRLLEAKCRSCHSDPQWQLNPLTRASMVGQKSDQSNEVLIVPFEPGESYLLHKVIDAYPVRQFTVQPPPWSGAAPLTNDEIRRIERWILTGARD